VFADPEPDNLIRGKDADGAVLERDPDRIHGVNGVHLFELQARMVRIVRKSLYVRQPDVLISTGKDAKRSRKRFGCP